MCLRKRIAFKVFDLSALKILSLNMQSRWVELFVTYDQLEAQMIKDLLESGGIAVEMRSAKVSPYPVSVGKMGEVKLFVREEDRSEAEELLRERSQVMPVDASDIEKMDKEQ